MSDDALGEFTLREKGQPETGDTLGEWILVDQTPVLFQPQESLVEKLYQDGTGRTTIMLS